MADEETNIISDDEFLKEIFSQVQKEEVPEVKEPSELEKILLANGEDLGDKTKPEEGDNSEEPKPESTKSDEEIQKEEKKSINRFGVKDTISTLIDNGMWADMPIKYGEKEYNNIEELIEKEKPSKELFELLSVAQKKFRDDQLDETYIKVGDKTSTKAKLVNAILNDIDYRDLLDYNTEVIEPLNRIDFASIKEGDRVAEAFVRQCLTEIDNYHPDSIDATIQALKKNFQIIEKAEEYQKITIENFNNEIENRQIERSQSVQKNAEIERESMKSLRDELKNQNITDSLSSKILKLRFTKDTSTDKYHYQNLIEDRIKDKSFEAKLMYFLLDDKDFIAKEKSKVKSETAKTFLELVNAAPKSQSGQVSKGKGNLQTDDEDFLREIGLIKD